MDYTLAQIAKIIDGKCHGNGSRIVNLLSIDSRSVWQGNNVLFFALKGPRNDGHTYIPDLLEKGVQCFVISNSKVLSENSNGNYLVVKNTIKALQELAAYHRQQFQKPVISITGSNGKTIVKEWLFQVMHASRKIAKSPKSYNSQVGVPLSVWQLDSDYDFGIFEAGISQPGEMDRLETIIQPTIGLITNIGEAHQENFTSLEEKVKEKLKLFKHVVTIVYCKDHKLIHEAIQDDDEYSDKTIINWSSEGTATIQVTNISFHGGNTMLTAKYQGKSIHIEIPFTDKASVENAINTWVVLLSIGFNQSDIRERMKILSPVAMRLEIKKGENECTLINDSYNSDIVSLGIAIDYLKQQAQHSKRTIILSDIQQSGMKSADLYNEVTGLLNNGSVNRLFGIGEEISSCRQCFTIPASFYSSTDEFLQIMSKQQFENEAILIKGARQFQFERISEYLEQKAHQTQLEINLNAIIHNLNYFKSKLKPTTKIMVMVKAFSYGSGSYEITNLLQHEKVNYLGVAFTDEGVILRRAGINLPIMVMSPEVSGFSRIIENELEPEIHNMEMLEGFSKSVERSGRISYPIHLKIDTGMHRLGFPKKEIKALINKISASDTLLVKTTFTHLAASDEEKHDIFTKEQLQQFEDICRLLSEGLGYDFERHALNSSGIERFTEYQYEMVRLGIGIYGVSTINNESLKHISTLKSRISQIQMLKKGETVGYGRKGLLHKDSKIATVPIGYADGINRKLGNGNWYCLVNGVKAPTIGNICMDMCMLDVTNIEANEEDEVIIFGENNTISDIAEKLDTIPYEVLTSISSRVKRVYYQE